MAKYRYKKKQKYAEGSNVTRGRFDQLQRQETGPEKNFGNLVGDIGKFAINTVLTPLETITGRNFYDPEFTYSGMNKADAVTSGISSAATDIAGTYMLGPFYTGGKKAIQGGVNKLDADGSWDNTNAQVAMLGGPINYKYGSKAKIPQYFDAGSVMGMFNGGNGGGNLMSMFGGNNMVGDISQIGQGQFPNMSSVMSTPLLGQGENGSSNFLNNLNPNMTGTPFTSDATSGIAYGKNGNMNLGMTLGNQMRSNTMSGGLKGMGANMMGNMKGMSLNNLGSTLMEGDPNTMAIAGTDAGRNTRNWSGVGNFVDNMKSDTVQETKAKEIKAEVTAQQQGIETDQSDMLRYSSEGASDFGVVDQGNPMQESYTINAQGTSNVKSGWADKVGQGIAQVGDFASGFVGGDMGGMAGNLNKVNNFNNVTGMMSKYGSSAKHNYKQGSGVKQSEIPPGLNMQEGVLNVPENYEGYFNIPGKDHEDGGTFMNTPAEGKGNTLIEAELNEGAEVSNGETYISVSYTHLTLPTKRIV